MNFRFRPTLNVLESRETPSTVNPSDPGGGTVNPYPSVPAQLPPTGSPTPTVPPSDPFGAP